MRPLPAAARSRRAGCAPSRAASRCRCRSRRYGRAELRRSSPYPPRERPPSRGPGRRARPPARRWPPWARTAPRRQTKRTAAPQPRRRPRPGAPPPGVCAHPRPGLLSPLEVCPAAAPNAPGPKLATGRWEAPPPRPRLFAAPNNKTDMIMAPTLDFQARQIQKLMSTHFTDMPESHFKKYNRCCPCQLRTTSQ